VLDQPIPVDACSAGGFCVAHPAPLGVDLNAIWAFSRDDVWVFGNAGVALHFDGTKFSLVETGVHDHLVAAWASSPSDLFVLGGPRRLSGYAPGQIRGDNYKYVRAEAQYKLTKPIPLLGLSMLGGLQVEAGKMGMSLTEPELTGWQTSYGVYLAANSAFGPIYLGYAHGKHAKGRFYFFVGTP